MQPIELYPKPQVIAEICRPSRKALEELELLQQTIFRNFGIVDGTIREAKIKSKVVMKVMQEAADEQFKIGILPHKMINRIRTHGNWLQYPAWACRTAEGVIRICDENKLEMMIL